MGTIVGISNQIGRKYHFRFPNPTDLTFKWLGRYDGNDLVNEIGVNIPWVSGTGLDAIYDFSVLGDLRLDKSNATYWGSSLNAWFYYDALNPYHFKLSDFHYFFFQNQMASDNNFNFAKLTYSGDTLVSVDSIFIYSTVQDSFDLLRLRNYIKVYPLGYYDGSLSYSEFKRINLGTEHIITIIASDVDFADTSNTFLGDSEYFSYAPRVFGNKLRYQVQDFGGSVFVESLALGVDTTKRTWTIERNGTSVSFKRDGVAFGSGALAENKPLYIKYIGTVKLSGNLGANVWDIRITDLLDSELIHWDTLNSEAWIDTSGNGYNALNNDVGIKYDYLQPNILNTSALKQETNLICKGDSLTFGTGSTAGNTYPEQLVRTFNVNDLLIVNAPNKGIFGEDVKSMITNASTEIDSLFEAGVTDTLLFWGGANDIIDGDSAATIYANIKSYCQSRKAVGWKVYACTLTDGNSVVDFTTKRNAVNALIYSDLTSIVDGIVDLAGNANIGPDGAQNDTTYFTDGLHMTDAGYNEVQLEFYNKIKGNLTLLDEGSNYKFVSGLVKPLGYK